MNEFLESLKADLLDRRLLPLAGLALAALVAALAYVALGGGSGSSGSAGAGVPSVPPVATGISVSSADPATEKAVAETTDGFKHQAKGSSHNPFAALPGTGAKSASAASQGSSAGGAASASGSKGSGAGGSGTSATSGSSGSSGSSGGQEQKGAGGKTSKPGVSYHVTVLFGSLAPDPSTGEVTLTPYVNLKLFTALPNVKQPLLVFRGVTAGGKAATFTIVGEAILSGSGNCLPSALQCQAVDLGPGESEKLEYIPSGSTTVSSYELKVVSIEKAKAKSARAAHAAHAADSAEAWSKSQAGWEVLWNARLLPIPELRQSSLPGVLVFGSGRKAHAAKAAPAEHGH